MHPLIALLLMFLIFPACLKQEGGLGSGGSLKLSGERPSAQFGAAGDLLADINGDGFSDLAIGAPGDSLQENNSGTVYVFNGSSSGISQNTSALLIGRLNDKFGISVADLGDVNKDGFSDFAVGSKIGVFIFLGHAGGLLISPDEKASGIRRAETAEIRLIGSTSSAGFIVSSAGDIDQNSGIDLAIANPSTGIVYIYLNGSIFPGSQTMTLGQADFILTTTGTALSIAAVGNVNNDNKGLKSRWGDDFVVGVPSAGKAYLIVGGQIIPHNTPTAISSIATETYAGGKSGDKFGTAVAGVGTFDGDSLGDFAVSAPEDGGGKVYIYFGQSVTGPSPLNPLVVLSEGSVDRLGGSLSGMLGIPLQGSSPALLGAPTSDFGGSGAGSSFILTKNVFASGASLKGLTFNAGSSDQALRSPFSGFGSNGHFGGLIRGGLDLNGDGSGDLLIGTPGASLAGAGSGAAALYW